MSSLTSEISPLFTVLIKLLSYTPPRSSVVAGVVAQLLTINTATIKIKIITIFIVCFIVLNGLVYANSSNDRSNIILIEENIIFSESIIDNFYEDSTPVIVKTYYLPFGSIINDIKVEFFNITKISFLHDVLNYEIIQEINYNYYVGIGLENGQRVTILTIKINPVKYNPQKTLIEFAKSAVIKIEYSPSSKFSGMLMLSFMVDFIPGAN